MPEGCKHEFFWPLRAADGHYYQVCRYCGIQVEYNWQEMRRVDVDDDSERPARSRTSAPNLGSRVKSEPELKLLVELEPAYQVFFQNLADALEAKPPGSPTFRSVAFWRELVFNAGVSWRHFGESLVCHMIALAAVLIVSHAWLSQDMPRRRDPFENYHLSYYKASGSFPALRGNPSRVRPFRKQDGSKRGAPLRVAPEHAQAAMNAPNIKLNGPTRPNLTASNLVLPAAPLASTAHSRSAVSGGLTAVVAPPPEVNQGMSRRLGLPQASVVAPAAEPGVASTRSVMTVLGASVVAPPPVLQASMRNIGDINIGPAAVVAPAPRLSVGEQRAISGTPQGTLGNPLASAVPPPPSAPRSGSLAGGRTGLLSGGGMQVVPPPPSVHGAGGSSGSAERGRPSSLTGIGLQAAVPPAPSLQGAGSSSGSDRREGPLSGGISGGGVQGVAPAPSIGNGSGSGAGNGGGRQMAMNMAPAPPSPPPVISNARPPVPERPAEPATEEMPLRLIGLAMALPSSSYFSNYEVFIAERKLSKGLAELIKLVYVSLPYQRRLSDYGVDDKKIVKLRVSRDKSCDESLLQMTWPETDPHPDGKSAADSPALSAEDKKSMLPCYRTTADDYRKAISHR